MNDATSKRPTAYFKTQQTELNFIFYKIKKLHFLQQRIRPFLSEQVASLCQVANITNGKLVLMVENGAVATHIRFQSADLLAQFRQHQALSYIKTIHCIVRPLSLNTVPPSNKTRSIQPLSISTAHMINEVAKNLSDPDLKAIMQRIARRKLKPGSEEIN